MMNFATFVTTEADAQFISVIETSPQSAWASDAPVLTAKAIAATKVDAFNDPVINLFMVCILLLIALRNST
jgi:hypothetical protein